MDMAPHTDACLPWPLSSVQQRPRGVDVLERPPGERAAHTGQRFQHQPRSQFHSGTLAA